MGSFVGDSTTYANLLSSCFDALKRARVHLFAGAAGPFEQQLLEKLAAARNELKDADIANFPPWPLKTPLPPMLLEIRQCRSARVQLFHTICFSEIRLCESRFLEWPIRLPETNVLVRAPLLRFLLGSEEGRAFLCTLAAYGPGGGT